MKHGEVVFFDRRRAYGFIRPAFESLSEDTFFHVNEWKDGKYPETGQAVTYSLGLFRGKEVARDVKLAEIGGSDERT